MESFKHEAGFLKTELERIVKPNIMRSLSNLPEKFIGVHIRRGDFHYGDELQKDDYYLRAIDKARSDLGQQIHVLVFSDATDEELHFLGKVNGLTIMPKAAAIHDVLALSRASAVIGTNHSTFSYWGTFLSCGKPSYWSCIGHKAELPYDVCPVFYV